MKIAGLFAGIGGFELGMASAGHTTSMLCEIWERARAVLTARYPDVDLESDIVDLTDLTSEIELVVRRFAVPGPEPGRDDSRDRRQALGPRRPCVAPPPLGHARGCLLHAPPGLGRALRALVEAFEERGYRWAYRVVNSIAFLPERRERVLFVATTTDLDPASVLLADAVDPPEPSATLSTHAHGFYWTEGVSGLGWARDAIRTLKKGSTVGITSPPVLLLPDEPDWTEPAAKVGRASLRWSLVGNALTVPVAKWLGERLAEPGSYERDRDGELAEGARWPRAVRFDGMRRRRVEIGAFPAWRPRPPLDDFPQYEGKPLSARTTRGFLSRTMRSSLRFPPGFLDWLDRHAAAMEPRIPVLAAE